MSHDIHQYYFERYLRNEMPEIERITFEEQLFADYELNEAFEKYKLHRTRQLEALVKEHEASSRNSRLNSVIYLLISVIGIILAVNFYLDNRALRIAQQQNGKPVGFWQRIPFIGSSKDEGSKTQPIQRNVMNEPPPLDEADTLPEEPAEGELPFATDLLLHDTILYALNKDQFDLYASRITETASSDSLQKVSDNYYVEFWRSPINYHGYRFNGRKLLLYGVESPYRIYLLKHADDLTLWFESGETELIKDNDFHKF